MPERRAILAVKRGQSEGCKSQQVALNGVHLYESWRYSQSWLMKLKYQISRRTFMWIPSPRKFSTNFPLFCFENFRTVDAITERHFATESFSKGFSSRLWMWNGRGKPVTLFPLYGFITATKWSYFVSFYDSREIDFYYTFPLHHNFGRKYFSASFP